MKRINKNGFTMIELLAVITLLGIVMVVAIPNVSRLIEKSKESKMKSNENTLLIATKSYLQANKDQYPKSIGEVKKIEANVLKSSGFLKEDITDGNKKSCMTGSYVNVQKKNNSKYSYDVFLICPGDSGPGSTDSELDISGELWYAENGVDKIIEDGEEGAHLITKVTLHYKGNGLNLASYSYVVLVSYAGSDDGNYTAIINSDLIKVVGKVQEKDVELDLTGHVDTTRDYYIKVIAKAYDEKGGSKSFETGSRFKNDQAPICGHVKVYDGKTIAKEYDFGENPNFKWVNTPRKVTVECIDNNGSKCKKAKFSQVFTKTGNKLTSGEVDDEGYGYVRIEDNRGKTNDCLVKVNIDTKAPDVPTVQMFKWNNNNTRPTSPTGLTNSYISDTWSTMKVYTEPVSSDRGSGIDYYQYTTTGETTNKTNEKADYRNVEAFGKSYIKWRACDKLGYCSEYSDLQTIKIRPETPSVPTVNFYKWNGTGDAKDAIVSGNEYTPGTWTDTYVVVAYSSSDKEKYDLTYYYVKEGGYSQEVSGDYVVIRNEGKTKWQFYSKYASDEDKTSYRADWKTIKIDRTPPAVTVSVSNTSIRNCTSYCDDSTTVSGGIDITIDITDEGSGINLSDKAESYFGYNDVGKNSLIKNVAATTLLQTSGDYWSGYTYNNTSESGVKRLYHGVRTINSSGYRYIEIMARDNVGNPKSVGVSFNYGACSNSNPTGCDWITTCRVGVTWVHSRSEKQAGQSINADNAGIVCHAGDNGCTGSTKLYLIENNGKTGASSRSKVCYKPGDGGTVVYGNASLQVVGDYVCGWIYGHCLNLDDRNKVCPFETCPDVG